MSVTYKSLSTWRIKSNIPDTLKYTLFRKNTANAKYLVYLLNLTKCDTFSLTNYPSCTFCNKDDEPRHAFADCIYYFDPKQGKSTHYFMCEESLDEILQFGDICVNIWYLFEIEGLPHELRQIISLLFFESLKTKNVKCVSRLKKLDFNQRSSYLLSDLEKMNLKELKELMTLKNIPKPKYGSGKGGLPRRRDYIDAIKDDKRREMNFRGISHT